MKGSYVWVFDFDVGDGTIQESTEDTRVTVPRRSTLNLGQFPVYAGRLPRTDQLLHLLGPVEVLLRLGREIMRLVDFLRFCIVLLSILELLNKGSNNKADIPIFFP